MIAPREFQIERNRMLDFYYSTEADLLDVLRIIPVENHPSTFSPKLYNILQSSCSQVENLLRLLCDRFDIKYVKEPDSIYKEYSRLINKDNLLENQRVLILPVFEPLEQATYPFTNEEGSDYPKWWQQYNMTKHRLPEGFKKGNLGNTLNALAGVYALHCMAYYAQYAKNDFFARSNWYNPTTQWDGDGNLMETWESPVPESDLFYYAVHYNDGGAPIG